MSYIYIYDAPDGFTRKMSLINDCELLCEFDDGGWCKWVYVSIIPEMPSDNNKHLWVISEGSFTANVGLVARHWYHKRFDEVRDQLIFQREVIDND